MYRTHKKICNFVKIFQCFNIDTLQNNLKKNREVYFKNMENVESCEQ